MASPTILEAQQGPIMVLVDPAAGYVAADYIDSDADNAWYYRIA